MPGLRYDTIVNRPDEVLALTSLTIDEFDQLLPTFENAFQNHMRQWRLDGKPPLLARILPMPIVRCLRLPIACSSSYAISRPTRCKSFTDACLACPRAKPINRSTPCCRCCKPCSNRLVTPPRAPYRNWRFASKSPLRMPRRTSKRSQSRLKR